MYEELFLGWLFPLFWMLLTTFLFIITWWLWKQKHNETMKFEKSLVEGIISFLMALAIMLSINAVLQLNELPAPSKIIKESKKENSESAYQFIIGDNFSSFFNSLVILKTDNSNKLDDDIYKATTQGQSTFNEYASFFTSPIAIILGFLAIVFIIKIETERLQNERRHNREKSQDNLEDVAHYAIKLLEKFDQKSIDFFIKSSELEGQFNLCSDYDTWKKFTEITHDLNKYVIIQNNDLQNISIFKKLRKFFNFYTFKSKSCQMQELVNNDIYISQELIRTFYNFTDPKSSSNRKHELEKIFDFFHFPHLHPKLRNIHYQSISKIFSEYSKRKLIPGYSDIENEIENIKNYLDEIFLKTDYNINAGENRHVVECFQAIEQSIRDFNDIHSGVYATKNSNYSNGSSSPVSPTIGNNLKGDANKDGFKEGDANKDGYKEGDANKDGYKEGDDKNKTPETKTGKSLIQDKNEKKSLNKNNSESDSSRPSRKKYDNEILQVDIGSIDTPTTLETIRDIKPFEPNANFEQELFNVIKGLKQ